jgi:dipeptidase D
VTNPVAHLEPGALWARFDEIRRIPRPSKHEERIRQYVLDFAAGHGLETASDTLGNVVVRVPASPGYEEAPVVILQGHLDMVCEKNADKVHDFMQDPIELVLEGDMLRADGTTLGADNGVAVAAGLGLATDTTVKHGPLELLFTLDEETGLTGARELDASMLTGKLLLNLDSEEDGVITIGCAGGRDTEIRLPVAREAGTGGTLLTIKASGMAGGHSGVDIHLGRANAIKVLGAVLAAAGGDLRVVSLRGGSAHNAIPREAWAVVLADPDAVNRAAAAVETRMKEAHASTDPDLKIEVTPAESGDHDPMTLEGTGTLVRLIDRIPHGVVAMSKDIPDLVETSNNLAVVKGTAEHVEVLCSSRSSVQSELDGTVDRLIGIAREHGAAAEADSGYPGWQPNPDSPLLKTAVEVYEKLYGEKPEVMAMHAGLECGIIGDRVPGMDMISIGPTLKNPHSPSECVSVSSVKKMLGDYLNAILETLAGAR